MTKPDNRADNEAHLQEHIDHTTANLQEAEDYLDEHAGEISAEKQTIEAKKERRKESICSFTTEKKTNPSHNLHSKNKDCSF